MGSNASKLIKRKTLAMFGRRLDRAPTEPPQPLWTLCASEEGKAFPSARLRPEALSIAQGTRDDCPGINVVQHARALVHLLHLCRDALGNRDERLCAARRYVTSLSTAKRVRAYNSSPGMPTSQALGEEVVRASHMVRPALYRADHRALGFSRPADQSVLDMLERVRALVQQAEAARGAGEAVALGCGCVPAADGSVEHTPALEAETHECMSVRLAAYVANDAHFLDKYNEWEAVTQPQWDDEAVVKQYNAVYACFLVFVGAGNVLDPPIALDLMWHVHMMSPTVYYRACSAVNSGRLIDHLPDADVASGSVPARFRFRGRRFPPPMSSSSTSEDDEDDDEGADDAVCESSKGDAAAEESAPAPKVTKSPHQAWHDFFGPDFPPLLWKPPPQRETPPTCSLSQHTEERLQPADPGAPCAFQHLGPHLLAHCLSFCSAYDVCRVAVVSRMWANASRSPSLWQRLLERDVPSLVCADRRPEYTLPVPLKAKDRTYPRNWNAVMREMFSIRRLWSDPKFVDEHDPDETDIILPFHTHTYSETHTADPGYPSRYWWAAFRQLFHRQHPRDPLREYRELVQTMPSRRTQFRIALNEAFTCSCSVTEDWSSECETFMQCVSDPLRRQVHQ